MPEVASRLHLETLPDIVARALDGAPAPRSIAVTAGPGLIGCLLVGVSFAKGLAFARGLPCYAVHHIAGHLHAILVDRPDWAPPALALVVSGGHTELVWIAEWGRYERMARTIDDAAGEAFDKAAKLLGLGFPGGPALARCAESGGPERVKIAGPIMADQRDFSFSGIKTALKRLVTKAGSLSERDRAVLAASFQDEVVANLVAKTALAIEEKRARRFLVTGGVAANLALRAALKRLCDERGVEFAAPRIELCTDNAAMIGAAALAYPREPMVPDEPARAMWELC